MRSDRPTMPQGLREALRRRLDELIPLAARKLARGDGDVEAWWRSHVDHALGEAFQEVSETLGGDRAPHPPRRMA